MRTLSRRETVAHRNHRHTQHWFEKEPASMMIAATTDAIPIAVVGSVAKPIDARGKVFWFPYGLSYIAPALCTFLGMVLFHVAAFGCGTFKHEFETAPGYDNSYSVGYWKVENPEPGGSGCVGYGDDTSGLPKVWKIGRAAGVIGSLIIWTIALLVAVASFYSFKNPLSTFRLVGWLMIVMSPMSLLLLVGKFSEDGQYLKIDTGGIVALITSILWLVGAIFTMCGMRERAVTLVPRDIGGVVVGAAPRQATVVPSGMAEDTHQQDHGQAVAAHAVFSRERIALFPYGQTYIAPAICTVLGLIFFHVAAFGCSTFKTDVSTYSYYGMDAGAAFRSSKQGYWKFESPMDNGKCLKYNDFDGYDFTGAWKFGRAVGVIGSLLIWALFFVVAGASFYKYPHPKLLFRVVGGVMMGLSVMSLLLLVGLSSGGGESLKIAAGGVLAILSFLVWLGGGVATMFFVKEVLVVTTAMPAQLPKPMKEPDVKPIDPPETTSRSDDATNVITTPTPTSKVAEKEGNDEEVDA